MPIGGADDVSGPRYDCDIFDPAEVIDFFDNDPVAIEEQRRAAAGCVIANFAPDAFRIDGMRRPYNTLKPGAVIAPTRTSGSKAASWRNARFRRRR